MLYDLYRFETGFDLLFDNGAFSTTGNDNRVMNEKLVKIHKGVDNVLRFRVFDADRKRAKIKHLRIKGTLINKENRERVLVMYGDFDCQDGIFRFPVSEGELMDISAGFYDLVVTGEEFAIPEQPGEIMSTPFYTDGAANVRLDAEVTDSVEKAPIPTVVTSNWSETSYIVDGILTTLHYSTPIPANRLHNVRHGTITFTAKADNFRGKLMVFGSLNHTPPAPSNPEDYFPLNINETSNTIQFGDVNSEGRYGIFSGIDAWTMSANVMWVLFCWIATDDKGIPHPSLGDPILVLDDLSEAPNKLDRVEFRS